MFNIGDMVTNKEGTIQTVSGFYDEILSVNNARYKVKVFSFISQINGKHSKRIINHTDSDIFFEFEMRLMTEEELNYHNKFMCFQ